MRRADRLFQIVLLLDRGRAVTARELAEALQVSERTIYRDVADLGRSGVPISGEAGVGYLMRPGYRLPPLMFDAEELAALALEQLLFYPKAGDSTLDFSQMALEGRAQPLVAFLTPERRRSLAARYKKRTSPRMMMPNQKKLWEVLSH